ncbi:MAG TPA: anti-sigma factor [Bryobacteraceae bacterium]|jgi:anti-sigma factor RsiW|nr:anti-sigma factor [Bryobacteraceae bacterium]
MSCQQVSDFLDAYVDKELDVITASQFDRHLAECAACRAKADQYRQLHDSVQAHMEYFQAPGEFEQRLRARLYPSSQQQQKPIRREWFPGWRGWWAVAASILAVLLFTAALLQMTRRPSASDMLADQVVSSHIRSLLANHLSDVVSTDQHTVKPWFSGKLDFAPVVKDLSSKGFPLAGGRLDYLDNRPVAALVYKRRQHTINLFLWPSTASDSSPRTLTSRGYNVVHWTHAHMTYWAVSDVNAADLAEFVRDLGT